ncbi:DUF2334 domain-containing protein [Clostridium sp. B9]
MMICKSRYIYRIDDITEDMNWSNFNRCISIFSKYKVVPLIGVVPENNDEDLKIEKINKDFWKIIKHLKDQGTVEVCQHGYTHVLDSEGESILKSNFGFKRESEFTGKDYCEQLKRIRRGKEILSENGIETETFMAPSHTFDINTLKALKELGFKNITDGIGLTPYEICGIKLVPQQFGRPREFPIGLITICMHINAYSEKDFEILENHVKRNQRSAIRFSDGIKIKENRGLNNIFKINYLALRKIKKIFIYK